MTSGIAFSWTWTAFVGPKDIDNPDSPYYIPKAVRGAALEKEEAEVAAGPTPSHAQPLRKTASSIDSGDSDPMGYRRRQSKGKPSTKAVWGCTILEVVKGRLRGARSNQQDHRSRHCIHHCECLFMQPPPITVQ